MKYLRLFENHDQYYTFITNNDEIPNFEDGEIYCFTEKEISEIANFLKDYTSYAKYRKIRINTTLEHDNEASDEVFNLTTKNGSNWNVDVDFITVYTSGEKVIRVSKERAFDVTLDDESVKFKNWELEIDAKDRYPFVINKIKDEWFIVNTEEGEGDMMDWIKCDRLDGLFEYLKTKLEKK